MYCASAAMLFGAAARVSAAACSAGSVNRRVASSYSTMRPVNIAPSHSRT